MKYIVMPAYNAATTLAATLQTVPQLQQYTLVLCDDGSQDNTAQIARDLGITVITHPENLGYGANQKSLYQYVLQKQAEVIVMLHPDNQYDGQVIPKMLDLIEQNKADFVLGNRMFGQAARLGGMPWWKRLANRCLSACQRFIYRVNLSEFHSGLRAYRRQVLETINFMNFSNDFVFDSEMIAAALSQGFRLAEVPTQTHYFTGASSINLRRSIIYGLATLKVLWRYRIGYYKRRKFSKQI